MLLLIGISEYAVIKGEYHCHVSYPVYTSCQWCMDCQALSLMFIMRLACPHTITVQLRFVDLHTYFLVVFHWIQLCYVFHLLLCLSLRCFSGSDYAILSTDLHTHVSVAPWYVDPRGDHDSCSRLAHVDTYYPWLIILTCLPLILFVLTTLRVQILPSYFLLIYI